MSTALTASQPHTAIALGRSIAGRISFLPTLLVALVAGMSAIDPQFYGIINILNILRNASFLAIVACGQALVIIAGGFDLSVGAVVALASVVTAKTMAAVSATFPGNNAAIIASGVAAGLGCGLGVGLMITSGIPVYGMPDVFVKGFGRAQVFGLPTAVYVALAVVLMTMFAQRRTLFGRYVYAIGGNVEAAVVSGVSIQRHIVGTYIVSSVLAALTGILLTAQVGSGQASFGGDRM